MLMTAEDRQARDRREAYTNAQAQLANAALTFADAFRAWVNTGDTDAAHDHAINARVAMEDAARAFSKLTL